MSTNKLVHGVFNPISVVFDGVCKYAHKSYDLTQFIWIGPEICPFEYIDDPEVVIVLDVTLGNLQETFQFAWEWVKDGYEASWRYYGHKTDLDRLRLLEGSETFRPFTLRWRRIKLNANIDNAPIDVRSSQTSPGIALLLVAAQHPERVKMQNLRERGGWFIPGIEVPNDRSPGQLQVRSRVYAIDYSLDDEVAALRLYDYGSRGPDMANPVFQE